MLHKNITSMILSEAEGHSFSDLFKAGMLPVFRSLRNTCSDEQQRHILGDYITEMGLAMDEINAECRGEGVYFNTNGRCVDRAAEEFNWDEAPTYQELQEEFTDSFDIHPPVVPMPLDEAEELGLPF